jgi:hypothetical protein
VLQPRKQQPLYSLPLKPQILPGLAYLRCSSAFTTSEASTCLTKHQDFSLKLVPNRGCHPPGPYNPLKYSCSLGHRQLCLLVSGLCPLCHQHHRFDHLRLATTRSPLGVQPQTGPAPCGGTPSKLSHSGLLQTRLYHTCLCLTCFRLGAKPPKLTSPRGFVLKFPL